MLPQAQNRMSFSIFNDSTQGQSQQVTEQRTSSVMEGENDYAESSTSIFN